MSRLPARLLALGIGGASLVVGMACEEGPHTEPRAEGRRRPDSRLEVHAIAPSTPTPGGLAYIETIASVHRRVDEAQERNGPGQYGQLVTLLRQGLALPVPGGLDEAEVLRLELAARLCETLLDSPEGPRLASDLLARMLDPETSVPLDRAAARALVCLGDAALRTGDDALAAGSYARAIRLMSLLRQELEP